MTRDEEILSWYISLCREIKRKSKDFLFSSLSSIIDHQSSHQTRKNIENFLSWTDTFKIFYPLKSQEQISFCYSSDPIREIENRISNLSDTLEKMGMRKISENLEDGYSFNYFLPPLSEYSFFSNLSIRDLTRQKYYPAFLGAQCIYLPSINQRVLFLLSSGIEILDIGKEKSLVFIRPRKEFVCSDRVVSSSTNLPSKRPLDFFLKEETIGCLCYIGTSEKIKNKCKKRNFSFMTPSVVRASYGLRISYVDNSIKDRICLVFELEEMESRETKTVSIVELDSKEISEYWGLCGENKGNKFKSEFSFEQIIAGEASNIINSFVERIKCYLHWEKGLENVDLKATEEKIKRIYEAKQE